MSKNGLLLVNKPVGISSYAVCEQIKNNFNIDKTGHSGTLDLNASGLLVLAINKATRILRFLPKEKKVYRFSIKWGIETTTWDMEGEIVRSSDHSPDIEKIKNALNDYIGTVELPIPYYSSKKVKGQRLYKLARKEIYKEINKDMEIEYLKMEDDGSFIISCSKGTYVRSVVHTLGKKVDCPATLFSLVRLENNGFSLKDAHEMDEILKKNDIFDIMINLNSALSNIKSCFIDDPTYEDLGYGKIPESLFVKDETHKLVYNGKVVAVIEYLKEKKVINLT